MVNYNYKWERKNDEDYQTKSPTSKRKQVGFFMSPAVAPKLKNVKSFSAGDV